MQHDQLALNLIKIHAADWTGKIRLTPRLRPFQSQASYSNDLRVRRANMEINLAAGNWPTGAESVDALIERARNNAGGRAALLNPLGMIGGLGIESSRIHDLLAGFAADDASGEDVRLAAVDALRFFNTDEALNDIFQAFAHDPSPQIRYRAALDLSEGGLFTRKQRLQLVDKLIALVEDPEFAPERRPWTFMALRMITDANLPGNPSAWRNWRTDHLAEKEAQFATLPWWQVTGVL